MPKGIFDQHGCPYKLEKVDEQALAAGRTLLKVLKRRGGSQRDRAFKS